MNHTHIVARNRSTQNAGANNHQLNESFIRTCFPSENNKHAWSFTQHQRKLNSRQSRQTDTHQENNPPKQIPVLKKATGNQDCHECTPTSTKALNSLRDSFAPHAGVRVSPPCRDRVCRRYLAPCHSHQPAIPKPLLAERERKKNTSVESTCT